MQHEIPIPQQGKYRLLGMMHVIMHKNLVNYQKELPTRHRRVIIHPVIRHHHIAVVVAVVAENNPCHYKNKKCGIILLHFLHFIYMATKNINYKNPICTILWRDAAYTDDIQALENETPKINLTCGFIIETNEQWTNIACSVHYDKEKKSMVPTNGFIIPENAIIEFKKIDFYDKE